MLHVIAATLSLLLLTGMFGHSLDTDESESTAPVGCDEISDGSVDSTA